MSLMSDIGVLRTSQESVFTDPGCPSELHNQSVLVPADKASTNVACVKLTNSEQ